MTCILNISKYEIIKYNYVNSALIILIIKTSYLLDRKWMLKFHEILLRRNKYFLKFCIKSFYKD